MRFCSPCRRVWRLLALAALVAGGAQQRTLGQTASPEAARAPSEATADVPRDIWKHGIGRGFRKGVREAGFTLGAGFGIAASSYHSTHSLALATVHVGETLGENWEVLGELFGGVQLSPTNRTLVGVTPVIRYNFATGARWVPFVDGGVGLSYTSIRDGDLSTAFEFNLQFGAGGHYFFGKERALTVRYRWLHLSNAYIQRPNRGTNTQMLYAGLSWFF